MSGGCCQMQRCLRLTMMMMIQILHFQWVSHRIKNKRNKFNYSPHVPQCEQQKLHDIDQLSIEMCTKFWMDCYEIIKNVSEEMGPVAV